MHRLVRFTLLLGLAVGPASVGHARTASYGPLTRNVAVPAVQRRTNRSFVLIEGSTPIDSTATILGRLVVHDRGCLSDPRVVYPPSGDAVPFLAAAAREAEDGTLRLLARVATSTGLSRPSFRYIYSADGGESWRPLDFPASEALDWSLAIVGGADRGGPFVRGAGAQMLPATAADPFVVVASVNGFPAVYAIAANGTMRSIFQETGTVPGYGVDTRIVGSDVDARAFLVMTAGTSRFHRLWKVGLDGERVELATVDLDPTGVAGFLTPSGDAFLSSQPYVPYLQTLPDMSVVYVHDGAATRLVDGGSGTTFAVPTADFTGAWVLEARKGSATVLSLARPGRPLVTQWEDPAGPEVDALHVGASGNRLLIQAHRERPQIEFGQVDEVHDPTVALWDVGQPAPSEYREIVLGALLTNGFVHLDVDEVERGDPFVFDSGIGIRRGAPFVVVHQNEGVVRGSFTQRLVIPAVARAVGAHGSLWRSDVVLSNPGPVARHVTLRFVPGGAGAAPLAKTIDLAPLEVRTVPDILGTSFALDTASGALFLEPDGTGAIDATSRTYTVSPDGTLGMGVPATDVNAAASSRRPLSFAAALSAGRFRSNLVTADVGGRGAIARLSLHSTDGPSADLSVETPAGGRFQLDGLGALFGASGTVTAGVSYQPAGGETVAGLIAIDDVTNDPTYIGPDLATGVFLTVPAIVHAEGAAGARFQSDLYLLNVADGPRGVVLYAKPWDQPDEKRAVVTLQAGESRFMPDVLATVFGLRGVARLRYFSIAPGYGNPIDVVGLTTRTYTTRPDGGTLGLLVPPLPASQSAGSGESLEILLPGGDGASFRTNLAFVDLSDRATGATVTVRVELLDDRHVTKDSFDVEVPIAGGVQLDDLFRVRGFREGSGSIIRVSPAGGLVAAYATRLDNGTNDPTYFAGTLAPN